MRPRIWQLWADMFPNANVFDFIEKPLKEVLNEIQLTDAIAKTIPINGLYAVHFEGKRYDCGS